MAACHPSCTNSKVICATGLYFVAGTGREHGGNINYFANLVCFIVFGPKCSNLLPLRATQKQKYRERITFGIQYKNCLALKATPTENANIFITNQHQRKSESDPQNPEALYWFQPI